MAQEKSTNKNIKNEQMQRNFLFENLSTKINFETNKKIIFLITIFQTFDSSFRYEGTSIEIAFRITECNTIVDT